jgi:aminoglycoside 3-N-acetyltransferase
MRRAARDRVRRPPSAPRPVTLPELREQVLALGYAPGRDLLVHSAVAGMREVQGSLDETLAMLRELVTPGGTLLMPSHPLLGRRGELPVYDVRKSRSLVGMLTERFRRTQGVLRSPFPVAPILALGPAAALYTRDFHEESGGTAYGAGSPYHRLAERDGQVLYLGIDFIRTITLEHVAFDLLRGDHPIRDYYERQRFVVVEGGEEHEVEVLDHRKALERRLASIPMRRMILRSGTIRCADLGGLSVQVMDAGPFVAWHLPQARRRGWPYWTPPLATRRTPARAGSAP